MERDLFDFKRNVSQPTKAHIFSFFNGTDFERLYSIKNRSFKKHLIAFSNLLERDGDVEFHNKHTKPHLEVSPVSAVYSYFPSEKDKFSIPTEKVPSFRLIFEGDSEYSQEEQSSIQMLKLSLNNNKTDSDLRDTVRSMSDADILRFLQATGFDLKMTVDCIKSNIIYRQRYLPVYPTETVKKLINLGFMYIHGRDSQFRPNIMVNPNIWLANRAEHSFQEWICAVAYYMEYIIHSHCLLPGQIEQWNVIVNLEGVSVTSLPKEFTDFMDVLTGNYRCRMYRLYLLNMSFMLRMMIKVVTAFMNETHLSKIRILGQDKTEMFSHIPPCQVERRHGGEAENVTEHFFPPIFPTMAVEVDILLREDYLERINSGNYRINPHLNTKNQVKIARKRISLLPEIKKRVSVREFKETSFYSALSHFSETIEENPTGRSKHSLDIAFSPRNDKAGCCRMKCSIF